MESIIHADIFFFITTIAVVIFTIVMVVVGFKVYEILENVRAITERAKNDYDDISDGAKKIVKDIKDDGVLSTIAKLSHRGRKSRKKIIG